ncbi:MAG: hypothetical protein RBU25_01065, partial [Lentisphaeria bacterium]|nr:hypothetical protein [Lentisphaeria bacterium]
MKQTPILALLIAVCLASTGCVSGWIIAGGKNYEHLHKKRTRVEKVRDCFGEPEWRIEYTSPAPLRETNEYRAWQQTRKSPPFVWGEKDTADDDVVASCEVFKVTDLLADPLRAVPQIMIVGCSLCVAELADPFFIPGSSKWRRKHAHDVSWLTYWFDE